MAKLIPESCAWRGLHSMKQATLRLSRKKGNRLYTRVAGEDLRYSLEDDLVFVLAIFSKKEVTVFTSQRSSII